ncbi:hypothetical protein [Brucella intermedia]|uniref:hypothetical protein n=1 Tax=Brucella intermedia TaxID=94625 RepID=UPI00224ABD45|nr:hypothetical protein [Brucella intermedia]
MIAEIDDRLDLQSIDIGQHRSQRIAVTVNIRYDRETFEGHVTPPSLAKFCSRSL